MCSGASWSPCASYVRSPGEASTPRRGRTGSTARAHHVQLRSSLSHRENSLDRDGQSHPAQSRLGLLYAPSNVDHSAASGLPNPGHRCRSWSSRSPAAPRHDYGHCILLGLVLCLSGDLLLIPRTGHDVSLGYWCVPARPRCVPGAFVSRPHAAQCSWLRLRTGGSCWWRLALARAALPAHMRSAVAAYLVDRRDGGFACAVTAGWRPIRSPRCARFMASDVSVARDRFVQPGFAQSCLGLALVLPRPGPACHDAGSDGRERLRAHVRQADADLPPRGPRTGAVATRGNAWIVAMRWPRVLGREARSQFVTPTSRSTLAGRLGCWCGRLHVAPCGPYRELLLFPVLCTSLRGRTLSVDQSHRGVHLGQRRQRPCQLGHPEGSRGFPDRGA